MAAWICFHDRDDLFKKFLQKVLHLKEVCVLPVVLVFVILVFLIIWFVLVIYKHCLIPGFDIAIYLES